MTKPTAAKRGLWACRLHRDTLTLALPYDKGRLGRGISEAVGPSGKAVGWQAEGPRLGSTSAVVFL